MTDFWHLSKFQKIACHSFCEPRDCEKDQRVWWVETVRFLYLLYERNKLLGIVVPVYKNVLYVCQMPVSPSALSSICSELLLYVTSFSAWNFVDFCWIFYSLIVLKPEGAGNTSASGKRELLLVDRPGTVLLFWLLAAGFPQRRAESSTRPFLVGLTVDKMALGHVFCFEVHHELCIHYHVIIDPFSILTLRKNCTLLLGFVYFVQ